MGEVSKRLRGVGGTVLPSGDLALSPNSLPLVVRPWESGIT